MPSSRGILFIIIVAKPMKHAMIPGVAGIVLASIGAALRWNLEPGPRWYPMSLMVPAIPQCRAGVKMHEMLAGKA